MVHDLLEQVAQAPNQTIRTTPRAIRDAAGIKSLTAAHRERLQAEMRDAGLRLSPALFSKTLRQAGLDEDVTVTVRRKTPGHKAPVYRSLGTAGGRIASTMSFAAAVLAFVLFFNADRDRPFRMSGDLSVAIAPFAVDGGLEPDEGFSAATSLADQTSSELPQMLPTSKSEVGALQVQVAPPTRFPSSPLGLDTSVEKLARAAARIRANVVILGRLRRIGTRVRMDAGVWISAYQLADAEELSGVFRMGVVETNAAVVQGDIAARARFRALVLSRLTAIARFLAGLAYYRAGDFQRAASYFDSASARTGWPGPAGLALNELFAGNTAGRLGKLNSARTHYRRALRFDQSLKRARLGLAELDRAAEPCDRSAELARLLGIRREFAEITRVRSGDAASARLAIRGLLGTARVDSCVSEAGLMDRWELASNGYHRVLDRIGGHIDRFRTEAAEAHAGLGLGYLPRPGMSVVPVTRLRRARGAYARAAELAPDPRRRAFFKGIVDHLTGQLEQSTNSSSGMLPGFSTDVFNTERAGSQRRRYDTPTLRWPQVTPRTR